MAEPLVQDPALPAALDRVSRRALFVGVLALLAPVGAALSSGAGAERFYRSYLVGFVFWNGIGLGCLAVLGLQYLTGGAWGIAIRRLLEAGTRTLWLCAILFLPVAIGLQHVYGWSRPGAMESDELLHKKALYLNAPFFLGRAAVYFLLWLGLAWALNRWSLAQDASPGDRALTGRLQRVGAASLLIYALTVTFASIDWVMSLEPHWFSTMYGVIFMVSQALGAMALVIAALLLLAPLQAPVGLPDPGAPARPRQDALCVRDDLVLRLLLPVPDHLVRQPAGRDPLVPGQVPRRLGLDRFPGAALPVPAAFPSAAFAAANRNPRLLIAAAVMVVAVRFVDVLWLILPAFSPGHLAIHWTDLAVPIGIGGLWLGVFTSQLTKRPLLPYGDPDFEEALAHGRH